DLCVAGLGRTRLAKSVHDAAWAGFTAMLEYKAARYGRTFARVDRFFPSTRRCSDCGRINEKMALNVRAWDCPCGAAHDRDVNAALNVLAAGQADNGNDRGARVRPGLVPAPRGEAVTHPDAARSTRSVAGISVLQDGEDVNGSSIPRTSATTGAAVEAGRSQDLLVDRRAVERVRRREPLAVVDARHGAGAVSG
ncbi:transposase, partial [Dactylosporangium maewongense]|uniref:RNA-guided endonuclease InsQ/TnpB family protein n=1 Tax=Dactylosporangium maewongense TaxID=634393 RepID=UPI0031CFBC9C